MRIRNQDGMRGRIARRVAGGLMAVALATGMTGSALAQESSWSDGEQITGDPTWAAATYAAVSDDLVYQYATAESGKAWYATYDGSAWSDWQDYGDDQPGSVMYDPAPVDYDGSPHAFYTGAEGELYHVSQDDTGASTWEDVAGDYSFAAAPAASYYEDTINLYGYADDGYVYGKTYGADGWSDWTAVSDDTSAGKAGTEPYAVSWGGYDNVFWVGDDGTVYWNRYDGSTWTGATAIDGSDYGSVGYAVYAAGYEADESLYAYATTADGKAIYNTFDGDAWAGWADMGASWTGKGQPTAYTYEDAQHVVYTADDGMAYYTVYADGEWAEWEELGGNYGYDAQVYGYDDGMYLTYTGEDGKAYYKTYSGEPEGGY